MADDDKQPAKNLASNGLILAVLIATGAAVFTHMAPLQGARPPDIETPIHQEAAIEDVEARLWQDPFGAVAKQYRDQVAKDANDKSEASEKGCTDPHCKSPLEQRPNDQTNDQTLVLAVMVPGGTYSGDAEWRRRTRYAVVSALAIADFVPVIGGHIGYFVPETYPNADQPDIAFVYPKTDPNPNFPDHSIAPIFAAEEGGSPMQITEVTARPPQRQAVLPYEWFVHGKTQYALVLWLSEDDLGEKPLRTLSSLVEDLCSRPDKRCPPDITIKFLGPHASTTLRAMAEEVKSTERDYPPTYKLKDATFYAYSATADDRELLSLAYFRPPDVSPSIGEYMRRKGVNLYRTIASDKVLAEGIVQELNRRGVKPGATPGPDQQHIALISEWDTFYGRTFPETMRQAFVEVSTQNPQEWLHKFSYLRGLDGQTAAEVEGKKDGKSAASPKKQSSVVDLTRAQTDAKEDAKSSERPDGPGQFDYLRRIADNLSAANNKLEADGEGSIKAIGVVGGDVFDKLLVLRALRSEFRDALFFTTDLDAVLTMPSERDWTRNLIVASSFGLELHRDIQGDIPPFRSNYETSAFLAARLATHDFRINKIDKSSEKKDLQLQLSKWLPHARIFEITRTGGVLALGLQDKSDSHPCGDANVASVDLMACNDIQPPIPPLFHRLTQGSGVIIGCTLVASALLLLLTLRLHAVRKAALPFVVAGAFVAFSCGIAFVSPNFADWITGYGDGEPFTLQGASIWPTVLLRALGIVVSVSLIWQGLRQLDNNLIEIARDLRLPPPDEVTDPMANDESRSWRKKLESKFSYWFAKAQPEDDDRYKLELAWNDYVYRGRFIARSTRVLVLAVAIIIIWMLLCAIFGWLRFPARNETTQPIYFSIQRIYFWVTFFNLFSLQLLIFFVLDTTLLCVSLVSQLAKQQTQWHQNTRTYYVDRLGLTRFQSDVQIDPVIDNWIDLTFIERRTRCINKFIFYPFIVITLLLMSRSTLFANYPPDAPILITTGLSLIIAFGMALWLPHAAEKARDFAKRDITAAIVRTKGFEDDGRLAGQLEALLNRVNSLHGGAFRPFTQQPAVRALLLPLSVLGGNGLLETGFFGGLGVGVMP